jgi:ACS family tartrate transporter-like MFS transporter
MMNNGANSRGGLDERLLSLFWRKPADTIAERTRRRVSLHLIPYLFFLYILAYLDRVNVSVAQLAMQKPPDEGGLGFDRDITGFGFGIFFWGYWILEIPSTVSVVHWGARWVFVRILILWGLCAALLGGIGTPFMHTLLGWAPYGDDPKYQFYFLRFMLGFFEGGFFPSVIVYLSLWFRTQDRGKAIASFMIAIPVSSMFGNPLSGLLLDVHWFDLPGWRWIFILEGIIPIFAGFVTLFFLPDRPEKARWLPADECTWLRSELDHEHQSKQGHDPKILVQHLGRIALLTFVYFCLNVTSYGLSSFMPAIIKSQSGVSDRIASYLAGLPFVMGLLGMLVNGWHSDHTRERFWHAAVPLALYSMGIALTALVDGVLVWPTAVLILWVGTFMYAHLPAFWPIPTMFLGATVAAAAIGFINMIGNLGGSLGSIMAGKLATGQTSFAPALLFLAPWPFGAALIVLIVGYTRRKVPAGS